MKMHSQSGNVTVIVVVALLVGVLLGGGVGYVVSVNRQTELAKELAASTPGTAPTRTAAADTETEADRLRVMLGEKETAYAQLREENEQLKQQASKESPLRVTTSSATNAVGSSGRSGGGNFMDRIRKDNPEMAKQWEADRERRKQEAETRYQDALAKLQERRQQSQSPEETALVDLLLASMNKLHEVGESWQNMGSITGPNRMEQYRQLAQDSSAAYQDYSGLLAKDRQLRLSQLATQVGYKDPAQAKQFAESIQKIYEETDAGVSRMLGGPAPGFGRGRGAPQ